VAGQWLGLYGFTMHYLAFLITLQENLRVFLRKNWNSFRFSLKMLVRDLILDGEKFPRFNKRWAIGNLVEHNHVNI
jgi:hypothetical protein